MGERVIPLIDQRFSKIANVASGAAHEVGEQPRDTLGRSMHDLRISVTDRCNFRCTYCMPSEIFGKDYPFMPHAEMLTFEEIVRLAGIFVGHGVSKLRLTGGEPLLRKGIERLIEMLGRLRTPAGEPVEIALTTNGSLLNRKAHALRDAGLTRLTVSLDALDEAIFQQMNGADFPVAEVLEGINAAKLAGFENIKVNAVVRRGVNDGQILPLVEHFRGSGIIVRFIEYMDVGNSNGWKLDEVVSSREVIARIQQRFALRPMTPNYSGEVAARWMHADGSGELGVISSVTETFCGECTRARLTTEGRLYTCLFATHGSDLRQLLRSGGDDHALANLIGSVWHNRTDRYSELRASQTAPLPKVEMSYIGG